MKIISQKLCFFLKNLSYNFFYICTQLSATIFPQSRVGSIIFFERVKESIFFEQIKMEYIAQRRINSPRTRCAKMVNYPKSVKTIRHLWK